MKKRQWIIIAGLAVLVLSFLLMQWLGSQTPEQSPVKARALQGVEVLKVQNENTSTFIKVDGPLAAVRKIQLFAEVTGVLEDGPKAFKTGVEYRKGEILLSIENSEARANYEASLNQYISTLSRALPDVKLDYPQAYQRWQKHLKALQGKGALPEPPRPENEKLKLFLTGQGVYRDFENLRSAQIRLSKFTLRAPYNGVLTEANIETGTLVRAGQALGEFMATDVYEMETSVSPREAELIEKGDSVKLYRSDGRGPFTGVVHRKNAKVDPSSLRLKIFIRLKGESLHDGLYMKGQIRGKVLENSYRLDRNLLIDRQSVYLVRDSSLVKQPVEILHREPGEVVVRGLPDGAQLPKKPVPGAYPGMRVKIVKA